MTQPQITNATAMPGSGLPQYSVPGVMKDGAMRMVDRCGKATFTQEPLSMFQRFQSVVKHL
jgi:hypothetical protein